jgi:hypothetical protein
MKSAARVEPVMCAFCAASVEAADRVCLHLPLVEEGGQALYVHWRCLRSAVHADVPLLEVDAYQGGPL